jgi:carboxypeptidase PM20D1
MLGPTFNAMVRTTQALVTVDGGTAYNVLPDRASFVVNLRILPGETVESALEYLKRVVRDPDITVVLIDGTDPTPVSEIVCPEWQMLREVCVETWPDAVFAPYMLNGGTDSRFYHAISDHVYKFSPMEMTAAERGLVHGPDESIAIGNLLKTVIFYVKLLDRL